MSTRRNTLFSGVLVAVTSVAIGLVIAARLDLVSSSAAQTVNTSAIPAMNSAPITGQLGANTFRDIADAQTPMVVNIRTESRRGNQDLSQFFGGDELFRRFFGNPPEQRPATAQGEWRTLGAADGRGRHRLRHRPSGVHPHQQPRRGGRDQDRGVLLR